MKLINKFIGVVAGIVVIFAVTSIGYYALRFAFELLPFVRKSHLEPIAYFLSFCTVWTIASYMGATVVVRIISANNAYYYGMAVPLLSGALLLRYAIRWTQYWNWNDFWLAIIISWLVIAAFGFLGGVLGSNRMIQRK